jgi:hypothetical protein
MKPPEPQLNSPHPNTITLDGRKFNCMQALAASQDDYIIAHLRLASALGVLHDVDGKERTDEKCMEDLLTQILLAGRAHHILAGCLTEEGKVWNRAEADANAARFAAITDVSEKTEMRAIIVKFVIGFFSVREASSEISRRSAKVPPSKNAAPSTSGTSRRSSGRAN